MMMFSRPIPTTAANLIETSQLRRRYYSAQVYAQAQVHSLFLSLSYSGGTTARHDQWELRRRTDGFTCSPRHGDKTPPTSQLRAVTEAYLFIQKDSITKLGPTRDSNPGPSGVQPYMLATTPRRQLIISIY
ncbi:unnamed protein product, partial [Brenthis ino]